MGDGFASDETDAGAHVVLGHVAPFSLGPLCVEPALRRVSNERGDEEFVQPRVMQVLVALARARGQVLTRDDLIDSCWGGTIVGDDALNRVVSQVRKLADDIGQGAFSVETVTRVGYRLRSRDEVSSASQGAPRATARVQLRGRLQLPSWSWAALAPLLLTLLAGGWWLVQPHNDRQLSLGLSGFQAIGDGIERGLPASIDQEFRTALGDGSVALTGARADLILTGTVRRVGDSLRLMTRLEDAASSTTLWTRTQDVPVGDERVVPELARISTEIVRCGLRGAWSHHRRLSNAHFTLVLRWCDLDATTGQSFQTLDAARHISVQAPDFASGWLALAWAANPDHLPSSSEGGALRRESMAAALRVIALEPEAQEGYAVLAVMLSPDRAMEREALLRWATGLRSLICPCAYQYLGDFLVQSGRAEEALRIYRRGLDQESGGLPLWRLAMAYHLTGRQQGANDTAERIEALHPRDPIVRFVRRSLALWDGRWVQAAELTRRDRPGEQAALREAMTALAAGEPERIGRARAAIERFPVDAASELTVVPILAALGGTDSVLARLEASRARGDHYAAPGRMPGLSRPLLFDPLLRPIWYDPRFPAFLERAGFIRYWRESGSRPDMCRFSGAPSFCRLLGPERASRAG